MKTILVASTNPVKISAVENGFRRMFPGERFKISGASTTSGVSVQPIGDAKTLLGALNRAQAARQIQPDADFWVGLEGGVEQHGAELAAMAWIVVLSDDLIGKARTGAFFLPEKVSTLVNQGKELGEADDIIFGRVNSKQDNGAIGILSGNVIDRAGLYETAVILALVPFKNRELYKIQANYSGNQ